MTQEPASSKEQLAAVVVNRGISSRGSTSKVGVETRMRLNFVLLISMPTLMAFLDYHSIALVRSHTHLSLQCSICSRSNPYQLQPLSSLPPLAPTKYSVVCSAMSQEAGRMTQEHLWLHMRRRRQSIRWKEVVCCGVSG